MEIIEPEAGFGVRTVEAPFMTPDSVAVPTPVSACAYAAPTDGATPNVGVLGPLITLLVMPTLLAVSPDELGELLIPTVARAPVGGPVNPVPRTSTNNVSEDKPVGAVLPRGMSAYVNCNVWLELRTRLPVVVVTFDVVRTKLPTFTLDTLYALVLKNTVGTGAKSLVATTFPVLSRSVIRIV